MSVSSIASSCAHAWQPQSAKGGTATVNSSVDGDEGGASVKQGRGHRHNHGGRENTLVNAMMEAFKSLGIGQTAATASVAASGASSATVASATTVATTDAATTTATASNTDTTKDIEKAVHEFAHQLFQALREGGDSEQTHRHGHHEHRAQRSGGYGQGYGDMAQRMTQLAQTLGAPTASASAPTATNAPTVDGGAIAGGAAASVSAASAVTATSVADDTVATGSIATVVPAKSDNRLLEAFTKLFAALQPKTISTPTSTAESDVAAKLKQFLQTLAQAIKPQTANALVPATGSLLNVTA